MKKSPKQKGITLVEILLYMGIFAVYITFVFSITFYMQNIFGKAKTEYVGKIMIYHHLTLLQNHLEKTSHIEHTPTSTTFHIVDSDITKIVQYTDGGKMYIRYEYRDLIKSKTIQVFEDMYMVRFSINPQRYQGSVGTIHARTTLLVEVSWKYREKMFTISEFVAIPNTI